jgi:hypothetical protein
MSEENNEGADLTELFAYFGRTAYMANVLEMALAQTILQVEYMTNLRATVIATQGKNLRHVEFAKGGLAKFSLGQKLRMIALHKSQQPVATTSLFFVGLFRELLLPALHDRHLRM